MRSCLYRMFGGRALRACRRIAAISLFLACGPALADPPSIKVLQGLLTDPGSADTFFSTATVQATPASHLLSLRTRRGDTIAYNYDADNNRIIKTPTGQGAVTYGLDLLGEPYLVAKAANGG